MNESAHRFAVPSSAVAGHRREHLLTLYYPGTAGSGAVTHPPAGDQARTATHLLDAELADVVDLARQTTGAKPAS